MSKNSDNIQLIKAYQEENDPEAKKKIAGEIYEANLGLIRSIAFKYKDEGIIIDDLVQEGSYALLDCIVNFDLSKKVAFSTYLQKAVQRRIERAIKEQKKAIHIPEYISSILNKIMLVEDELSKKLGRIPKEREVADDMNISLSDLKKYKSYAIKVLSLDKDDNNGQTLSSIVKEFDAENPEDSAINHEIGEMVSESIDLLSDKEKDILTKAFGLDGGQIMPTDEIAKEYNVSPERIRQIISHATRMIKEELSDEK